MDQDKVTIIPIDLKTQSKTSTIKCINKFQNISELQKDTYLKFKTMVDSYFKLLGNFGKRIHFKSLGQQSMLYPPKTGKYKKLSQEKWFKHIKRCFRQKSEEFKHESVSKDISLPENEITDFLFRALPMSHYRGGIIHIDENCSSVILERLMLEMNYNLAKQHSKRFSFDNTDQAIREFAKITVISFLYTSHNLNKTEYMDKFLGKYIKLDGATFPIPVIVPPSLSNEIGIRVQIEDDGVIENLLFDNIGVPENSLISKLGFITRTFQDLSLSFKTVDHEFLFEGLANVGKSKGVRGAKALPIEDLQDTYLYVDLKHGQNNTPIDNSKIDQVIAVHNITGEPFVEYGQNKAGHYIDQNTDKDLFEWVTPEDGFNKPYKRIIKLYDHKAMEQQADRCDK